MLLLQYNGFFLHQNKDTTKVKRNILIDLNTVNILYIKSPGYILQYAK